MQEPGLIMHTTALRPTRGVTLIELMIGLAVLALMLMSGAPAFSDWIRNTQIRSAAESILGGIQYARTEAVRRNTPTRFQMVDTLDAACVVSASGRNWVVNLDASRVATPESQCDKAVSDEDEPFILQKTAATTSTGVSIAADDREVFVFNSVGQQIQVGGAGGIPPLTLSTIDITSAQGACVHEGGTARCLRIEISRGGQARLCDPGLANTPANQSMACEPL